MATLLNLRFGVLLIAPDPQSRLRRGVRGEAGSRRAPKGSGDLLGATQERLAGMGGRSSDGAANAFSQFAAPSEWLYWISRTHGL
jgi:hypothetical protein